MSLTYPQIAQRLWEQAHATNVSIRLAEPNGRMWGWVEARFNERRVRVYARRTDHIIRTVIHELIHDALRVELAPWGPIEEDIVLMVERRVWKYVRSHDALLDRWRMYAAELRVAK